MKKHKNSPARRVQKSEVDFVFGARLGYPVRGAKAQHAAFLKGPSSCPTFAWRLRQPCPGAERQQLVAAQGAVRNLASVPPLTVKQVLQWADAHHKRTGAWPGCKDGPIDGVPGETWFAIDAAMRQGKTGLRGDSQARD